MNLTLSPRLSKSCGHANHHLHVQNADDSENWRLCPHCWNHHGVGEISKSVRFSDHLRMAGTAFSPAAFHDGTPGKASGMLMKGATRSSYSTWRSNRSRGGLSSAANRRHVEKHLSQVKTPGVQPTPGASTAALPKAKKATAAKATAAPTLHPGERWITVHPHGEDQPGQPLLLKENHDGTHTVIGGAGGKLNGLRMTGVKSHAEYRAAAKDKAAQRRAQQEAKETEAHAARLERHKADVAAEYQAAGKDAAPEEIEQAAAGRALDEHKELEARKKEQLAALSEEERASQQDEIQAAADLQGWNPDEYQLSEATLDQARAHLKASLLQEHPDLRPAEVDQRVEKDVQKIADAHHRELHRRAREVLDNIQDAILTTHDEESAKALGDLAIGDVAKNTMGDAGKGFQVNLEEQAAARGMDLSGLGEQAQAMKDASAIERAGGDQVAAREAAQSAVRRAEAAAKARERIAQVQDALGEGGAHLEALKELPTEAATQDRATMVAALAKAKAARGKAKAAREAKARVASVVDIETLPQAAVVRVGKTLTHEEAQAAVEHDLAEMTRQGALRDLVDLYNAQDAISPLRGHRLAGQNAFFGVLGHLAAENGFNIKSPDPVMADILGASGLSHVLRRALENGAADGAAFEGIRAALASHHIGAQVAIANDASDQARELLSAAENLEHIPADTMDGLMAATQQAKDKAGLVREARGHLGVAAGRLEAAAALNEAMQGSTPADGAHVALGAISMEDALLKAHALGLDTPDRFGPEGELQTPGQFRIHDDGHNKILEIHSDGLDTLASGLHEDPAHLQRMAEVSAIKRGDRDEADWLPDGISRRPKIDVSRDPQTDVPDVNLKVNIPTGSTPDQIKSALRDNIAERIEAGQDPTAIISELGAAYTKATGVPEDLHDAYSAALGELAPAFKAPEAAPVPEGEMKPPSRSEIMQARIDHKNRVDELLRGYHSDWLDGQVKSGKMDSADASVHRQTLPQTDATRDLVHQVHIQDPRLQHGFSDVGELGREGKGAVRDYAFEHVFRDNDGKALDPKDKENPIQALSPDELKAWQGWRGLESQAAGDESAGGDIYRAIQNHWKESDANSGGGMFDDEPSEPHAFASVDLSDDGAVIEAAKLHAQKLGYTPERRVKDLATRDYEDVVPELETRDDNPQHLIARDARARIKSALRDHAFQNMLGAPDLAGSKFNPASVQTGSQRWAQYVADMGGEKRAYRAMQDVMKGDFAQRFAKGYQQQTGAEWKTVATAIGKNGAHGDAHALAMLSPEKREAVESQLASERARAMNREGGKFAEGGVKERLEAAAEESKRAGALFSTETGKSEDHKLASHRVTLGAAAENMVKGMIPNINLKKGTSAAGDIDMSTGENIKRQRAVKQLEATHRLGLSLGTGAGKTVIGLGAVSHLRNQGKIKRAIFATPADVQANFGAEAARFYDPNSPAAPSVFAQSGVSPQVRRASYHKDSGHDVVVVTHHALRDDLTWALAQHKFGGDEKAAKEYIETAPEAERDAAIQDAAKHHGWDFEMSAIDEGQTLLNREGKENSAMANVIDSFTRNKDYHATMSADPVRNDASEAFDFLRKVAPHRYVSDDAQAASTPGAVSRGEFLRKYATNTPAAYEALQREMAPYHYAESIDPKGVSKWEHRHEMPLTPAQKTAYSDVLSAYQRARDARRRGVVDVDAMKTLSPGSFGPDASSHEETAKRLQESAGMARDSALDRVVNTHPGGAKFQKLDELLQAKPAGDHPKIIFARSRAAVDAIHKHLESQGVRAVKVDGSMSADEREKRKAAFSPQWDEQANNGKGGYVTEPTADVIIYSDCGAKGWNGQRGSEIYHWDTPATAETYRQREGRAYRTGQRSDVHVHSLATDTPYEKRRREVLDRKDLMRDKLTASHERIDDSGLGGEIASHVESARQKMIESKVAAARGQKEIPASPVDQLFPKPSQAVSPAGSTPQGGQPFVPTKVEPSPKAWQPYEFRPGKWVVPDMHGSSIISNDRVFPSPEAAHEFAAHEKAMFHHRQMFQ